METDVCKLSEEELYKKLFALTELMYKAGDKACDGGINKQWKNPRLKPCNNCKLHDEGTYSDYFYDAPVPVTFYPFKENKKIEVMIISRDPNFEKKDGKVRFEKGVFLENFEKSNTGLLFFIRNFCKQISYWSNYSDFIKEFINDITKISKGLPSVYWTHMVKCYAMNDEKIVRKAYKSCKCILNAEIEFLKPKLIIGLGEDVEKALKEMNGKNLMESIITPKKMDDWLRYLKEVNFTSLSDSKPYYFILPHPSGKAPYNYEWGDEGQITFSDVRFPRIVPKCTETLELQRTMNYIKTLVAGNVDKKQ